MRIAAAGTLAYHHDASGARRLRDGLGHARWEVRWWCGKSLATIGAEEDREAIARRLEVEDDAWVKGELADVLHSFPGSSDR